MVREERLVNLLIPSLSDYASSAPILLPLF
jgi:hypothetical protein